MILHSLDEVAQKFLTYAPPDMIGQYRLDRIHALMNILDNPQEQLRVIHIAGTSGKTSTAYFIRGFLEAAGLKTGLTVSPHIETISERVQVGGVPLEEKHFLVYANRFFVLIEKTDLRPTYFELCVSFAYWVFAQEQVDYAVVETGLGGLLDGTNVVSRSDKICVITDIGLDHTEILGDTVELIATQKAGIIQPHNAVLIHDQSDDIMHIFRDRVKQQAATIEIITNNQGPRQLPHFQRRNWSLAEAVVTYITKRDNINAAPSTAKRDVIHQTPPGRWEVYHYSGKRIILDGAHNPQKLSALRESFDPKSQNAVAILANLIKAPEEKAVASLEAIRPITSYLIIPEFTTGQDLKSRQSFAAQYMATLAKAQGFKRVELQPDAIKALHILLNRPEETLLITGSLYLISQLRPILIQLVQAAAG